MASYRRFISYMYTCEHEKKGSNCGFIKAEIRDGYCNILFQLKNVHFTDNCHIYLYCPDHNPIYILLHSIPVNSTTINYRLKTSSIHMTSDNISFDECSGLLCTDEHGNNYGTCWTGDTLPAFQITEAPVSEPIPEKSLPPENEPADSSPPKTFAEQWTYMQKEFPSIDPFEDNSITETIKIAPADLSYLHSFQPDLGSNQFILHGYESYHHLLLGRIHGQMRYVIGIPGIYDQQEQFMAKMFGFPCFKPALESRQKKGQFGYWLRCFK